LHLLSDRNPLFLPFQEALPLCFDTREPFSLDPLFFGKTLHNQEMYLHRQDGTELSLLVNAGPLLDERGKLMGCVVAFTDITERQRSELERQKLIEDLQQSEEELQAANEELRVQTGELLSYREKLQRAHDALEQQVAERTADLQQTVWHLEKEMTERQEMEEALRQSGERLRDLAARLLEVQEQERMRLSMDLHDDLGQSLLVLKMQLSAILRLSSLEPPVRHGLAEASRYLIEIINKVRGLSHALSPMTLANLGLMRAMGNLLGEFQQYHEITVEADLDEVDQLLSKGDHIRVYRILQEFLANVHKHSEATQVTVIVKALPEKIAVSMEDNGKGFNLEEIKARPKERWGLGVFSMEERLKMMGSQFSLTSQPGQGTHLYFELSRYREEEALKPPKSHA
jgi:signal transduction histidine kinase